MDLILFCVGKNGGNKVKCRKDKDKIKYMKKESVTSNTQISENQPLSNKSLDMKKETLVSDKQDLEKQGFKFENFDEESFNESKKRMPNKIFQKSLKKIKNIEDLNKLVEKATVNTASAIELIKIFPYAYYNKDRNYRDSAQETMDFFKNLRAVNDNYFVRSAIDKVLDDDTLYDRELYYHYNDATIKNQIMPEMADDFADEDWVRYNCSYSKISDEYAVIYDFEGNIESFFSLKNKNKKAKRLELEEIIEKNSDVDKDNIEEIAITYDALLSPLLRKKIESDFGIKLNQFDVKFQLQLLKFISNKNEHEVNEVIDFINQSDDEKNVKNRIKSFLSLESGELSGEEVMKIGESLNNSPELQETANKLFQEYAGIVDGAEQNTDDLIKMYNEIFFDKKIDREKASQAVLGKASELLKSVSEELTDCSDDEKNNVVKESIVDLRRQEKVQNSVIENFKKIIVRLNKQYKKSSDNYTVFINEKEKEEIRKQMKIDGDNEEEINDYLEYVNWAQDSEFDGVIYDTLESYNKMLKREEQHEHFDSNRIKKIIAEMETYYKDEPSKKIKHWLDNFKENLKLQQDIEQKLDQFIYGEENKETSNVVLNKYQEIVDEAGKAKDNIKKFFKDKRDISDDDIDGVINSIMARANDLLQNYTEQISKEEDLNDEEILNKFEEQKADVLVFASIFQIAYEQSELNFDELKGVDYQTLSSLDLSSDDQKMIKEVVKSNYPKKKQQVDILEKIEKSFKNKDTKWHLLTRNTEDDGKSMVACVRFDEIDDDNVYAATFNVGTGYRGSKLGEAMFNRVMTETAKTKKIHAITEMGKEVSDFYINKGGFNVSAVKKNKKTEIYYYSIERSDVDNEFYGSKRIEDEQDLLKYYDPKAKIADLISKEKYILVKKSEADNQENMTGIDMILNNGYLMTRTVADKKDKYLVFEKRFNQKASQKKAA